MTPVQRVLATARSENGYLEKATNAQLEDKTANAGYNNWNKFAAFLDDLEVVYNGKKNGYAWCDCFVDYCFIYTFGLELGMAMTFQPKKGAGAGCRNSARPSHVRWKGRVPRRRPDGCGPCRRGKSG